jgi:ATP-dependent DNA ligase
VRSVLLDGAGIVYDESGMPSFDLIHSKQHDREASLIAFDLLELDGEDVRKNDLLARKLRLKVLVGRLRARHRIQRSCRRGRRGDICGRVPARP